MTTNLSVVQLTDFVAVQPSNLTNSVYIAKLID